MMARYKPLKSDCVNIYFSPLTPGETPIGELKLSTECLLDPDRSRYSDHHSLAHQGLSTLRIAGLGVAAPSDSSVSPRAH